MICGDRIPPECLFLHGFDKKCPFPGLAEIYQFLLKNAAFPNGKYLQAVFDSGEAKQSGRSK
jgi:hypothetical protein